MGRRPIAEQLKGWREARGVSQRALAEKAGVGQVLVARLELGQTDPRLSTVVKLADALKVSVADLIAGKPARTRAGRR
jgi:predicted transcriptional regulator